MAEAFGYRETLELLAEKHPMTVTQKDTAKILGCSLSHLKDTIIKKGHIKVVDGKIPLGSIARYICGYC